MNYDKRTALPQDHDFEIRDQNTGNTYFVTIEKELGRGGSCVVYTGRLRDRVGNEQVTRSVIIKELYPKELDDVILRTETMDLKIPKDIQEKFQQSLDIFCAGQAKHIIYANDNAGSALPPTTYSGMAHNTFYAVSQRGQGITLSDIDRQSLSLADALIIAASVCDAIHEIHARGMNLYLDCKPDNICVFENKAYLFAFDTVQPRGRFRFCSYSEGWSAPEQVFKDSGGYIKPQKIGFHTDVFSIGAVLFYLLVGRKPTDDDLNRIKDGYDWRAEITLDKSGDTLKDESFVKELDRVMRSLLEQDPDARRLDFGDKEATAKVAHDFRHLLELAENAPYRRGFEDTNDHITRAKELILYKQDEILSLLRNISLHESETPHFDKGSADKQHTEKPTEECRNPNRTNSMRDYISAPVFNSIIDHPVYGDEREFVHIREHGKTDWLRSITLETGKQYEVEIRFRNDASEKYNGKEYHHVGIAFRSVLAVDLPIYLNRHEDGITVRISAENAASASQDSVKLIPGVSGLQYLHYVAGSCKISCKWKANGQIMPSSIFRFTKGTLLGLNGLNGIIPGGDEYAGRVCFVFEVKDHKEQSNPKQQLKPGWGPEREMFTMKNPAKYPSINSIVDNPTIGDERAFLRIGAITKEKQL